MTRPILCLSAALAIGTAALTGVQDDPLRSRAERTEYVETSRLEDVTRFLDALAVRSPLATILTFGTTEQGRPMPLAVLSSPPVRRPADRPADRPVVWLLANIHGGEVEGKEAVQALMRRLASGDLRPLLDRMVVIVAPVYNVDGNEAVDVMNRTSQHGPIGGVGRRENANGLDLNRDYMKLEAAESRALVAAFTAWDPHLVVDLHTTNGSYHGYHLTYSVPLNLSLPAPLLAYHRDRMMPAITATLADRHQVRAYYYGNFGRRAAPAGELRRWSAFDHRPRAGQNYVGFRNRLTILSEAYSYLSFQRRVEVTGQFVEEILRYVDAHGADIVALARSLDDEWIRAVRSPAELALGVQYELRPLSRPVPILVGEVRRETNPRNGREMTVALEDRYTPEMMLDYAVFAPTRSVSMARAYALPRETVTAPIVEKLRQHGVEVEELTASLTTDVTSFVVGTITQAQRPFQGHHEVTLTGEYVIDRLTLPAGTVVVRLAQPLGRLAAYLLEPESDDGLVNWNFFDAWLEPGTAVPIRKIMSGVEMATRRLDRF